MEWERGRVVMFRNLFLPVRLWLQSYNFGSVTVTVRLQSGNSVFLLTSSCHCFVTAI